LALLIEVYSKEKKMRKLATIQKITDIKNIEKADKVVMARVLGYECVIKKDLHKVNDLIVYIECDSLCPENKDFEFLKDVKYRVKIRRFRGQISEGLVMPLSILPANYPVEEGTEVTDVLGIKNFVRAEEDADELNGVSQKNRSKLMRFLMGFKLFRKLYLLINSKEKGNFPTMFGVSKTDETRLQNSAKMLMDHYNEEWYISEKVDGSSFTAFVYQIRKWGILTKKFGVCSRNIWLKTKNNSNFWKITNKYNLEKVLMEEKNKYIIQGECCGPAIQKNKYNLTELELFVFNVFENGILLGVDEMEKTCERLGLKTVPIVNHSFIPEKEIGQNKEANDVVDYMVKLSQGNSTLLKRNREGIVCRLKSNPRVSFKVINPDFLLEN
jgi:hypothetical protein